jgi:hypothetical protein
MKSSARSGILMASLVLATTVHAASVSTFDDLPLGPDSVFDPGVTTQFTSGGAIYQHVFDDFGGGCCAGGWTYSNQTDVTTPGFLNAGSAITGGGVDGSANYGVAYLGDGRTRVSFATPSLLSGAYFTNTTYTYLAIKEGNDGAGFVKGPFSDTGFNGGPDFLRLTIFGRDASDVITGSVEFLLADGDGVVADWTWIDLGSLGLVSGLSFAMSSSDTGPFGMNTPAYFALDNLTFTPVPLPAGIWLLGGALGVLGGLRRRTARV